MEPTRTTCSSRCREWYGAMIIEVGLHMPTRVSLSPGSEQKVSPSSHHALDSLILRSGMKVWMRLIPHKI